MARRTSTASKRTRPVAGKKWSAQVTQSSHALDLEEGVFKGGSAKAIAHSLKRSAEASLRRKSDPYRSAMSMLTFYINRGGKNLPKSRVRILEQAKDALRELYHTPRRAS